MNYPMACRMKAKSRVDLLNARVGQCEEGLLDKGVWVLIRKQGRMPLLQNVVDLGGGEGELLLHGVVGDEGVVLHGVECVDVEAAKGEVLELQRRPGWRQPKQRQMLLRTTEM